MVLKGFPNGVTSGQQYNVREKPTVTRYTYYINRHAGTPDKNKRRLLIVIIQKKWTRSSRLRYRNMVCMYGHIYIARVWINRVRLPVLHEVS